MLNLIVKNVRLIYCQELVLTRPQNDTSVNFIGLKLWKYDVTIHIDVKINFLMNVEILMARN